jgi:hypothetical protein
MARRMVYLPLSFGVGEEVAPCCNHLADQLPIERTELCLTMDSLWVCAETDHGQASWWGEQFKRC